MQEASGAGSGNPAAGSSAAHKQSRARLTEEIKAKIVNYHVQNPKRTYGECLAWAKTEFRLEKVPSETAMVAWLKPETKEKLLEMRQNETRPAKRAAKT